MMPVRKETYKVAGHCFCLELPDDSPVWDKLGNYTPFRIANGGSEPLFTMSYDPDCAEECELEMIDLPGSEDPRMARLDIYRSAGTKDFSTVMIEAAIAQDAPVCARLLISGLGSKNVPVRGRLDRISKFSVDNSLMVMYAFATSGTDTLEMHSSTVIHDGKAYMFLGKSGTGKSTHSSLWLRNIEGSRLLNDDNPVIRMDSDGTARVYGSPWSGKTPCYINDSAPVGAIVNLHQAPYNKIKRQSIPKAYASIYASCSGLKFDDASAEGLHRGISAVVTSVPCYDLECLPDREAALLCHSTASEAKAE